VHISLAGWSNSLDHLAREKDLGPSSTMLDRLLLRVSGGDKLGFRHARLVGLVCLGLLVRLPPDGIDFGILSFGNPDEAFPY
jgi:hypothetical protein